MTSTRRCQPGSVCNCCNAATEAACAELSSAAGPAGPADPLEVPGCDARPPPPSIADTLRQRAADECYQRPASENVVVGAWADMQDFGGVLHRVLARRPQLGDELRFQCKAFCNGRHGVAPVSKQRPMQRSDLFQLALTIAVRDRHSEWAVPRSAVKGTKRHSKGIQKWWI